MGVLDPKYAKTALHLAGEKGSLKIAQALLAAGADAKAADKYAKIVLHFASEKGSLEIVQALLAAGADARAADKYAMTA